MELWTTAAITRSKVHQRFDVLRYTIRAATAKSNATSFDKIAQVSILAVVAIGWCASLITQTSLLLVLSICKTLAAQCESRFARDPMRLSGTINRHTATQRAAELSARLRRKYRLHRLFWYRSHQHFSSGLSTISTENDLGRWHSAHYEHREIRLLHQYATGSCNNKKHSQRNNE